MVVTLILAAIAFVAPKDGLVVQTQKPVQRAFFSAPRAERLNQLTNAASRAKLLAAGAMPATLRLAWTGEKGATYLLTVSQEGADDRLFSVEKATEAWLTNLAFDGRYGVSVRQAGTTESAEGHFAVDTAVPRFLRVDGVGNFRDMGGWTTADGRRVRTDRVYRSAVPSAKAGGLKFLADELKVRTELDLREAQRRDDESVSALGKGARRVSIPFVRSSDIGKVIEGREAFGKIFTLFLHEENYPILIESQLGRDRVGTLAFLLNGLLGVAEDDLCKDWEASAFGVKDSNFSVAGLDRLIAYLKRTYPAKTLTESIAAYARGCGITDGEVAVFRSLLLK